MEGTLSSHTQDLMKSSKASITVQASGFRGAADARVNLMGDIENVTDESIEQKYRLERPYVCMNV
eukprot:1330758-Amorphochlora_amoeboformis.AAC.5